MKKPILLYSAIYPDTAAKFIGDLDACGDSDVRVLVNCPGGDPYSTYGMIAMANERDNLSYDVHGQASSCAAYMVAGSPNKADNTCLNVSAFIFHRAASWMEGNATYFTDAVKAELEEVNKNLRGILEKGIGADNFKKITGTSLDEMFDMSKRIDVRVNAKQAVKLGIIGKIVSLSSKMKAEIESNATKYHIAAFAEGTTFTNIESSNDTVMEYKEIKTLAELEAAYPTLVAEMKKTTTTEAIANEKMRIESWSAWALVDPEAVAKGIAGDKFPTPADTSKFQVKMASPDVLKRMIAGNANVTTPPAPAGTEAKAKIDAFMAEVDEMEEDEDDDKKAKKTKAKKTKAKKEEDLDEED